MLHKNPTLGFVVYLALITLFIVSSVNWDGSSELAPVPLVAAMWAMVVIRSTISEGPHSLLDALRLFTTIIAANAALAWEPAASFSDIGKIAALTALIIPAYLLLIWAIPSQRPAQMGLRFGWPFWITVFGLLGLSLWNFAYDMHDNWGLALINTLSLAVFFMNAALPISARKTPFRENWRARVMAATSFPLGLYAAFAWPNIVLSQGTPIAALVTAAATTLGILALSPWFERRPQPK